MGENCANPNLCFFFVRCFLSFLCVLKENDGKDMPLSSEEP